MFWIIGSAVVALNLGFLFGTAWASRKFKVADILEDGTLFVRD